MSFLSTFKHSSHWGLRWKTELRQQKGLWDQSQISLQNEKYFLKFFIDLTPVVSQNSFNSIETQGLALPSWKTNLKYPGKTPTLFFQTCFFCSQKLILQQIKSNDHCLLKRLNQEIWGRFGGQWQQNVWISLNHYINSDKFVSKTKIPGFWKTLR